MERRAKRKSSLFCLQQSPILTNLEAHEVSPNKNSLLHSKPEENALNEFEKYSESCLKELKEWSRLCKQTSKNFDVLFNENSKASVRFDIADHMDDELKEVMKVVDSCRAEAENLNAKVSECVTLAQLIQRKHYDHIARVELLTDSIPESINSQVAAVDFGH